MMFDPAGSLSEAIILLVDDEPLLLEVYHILFDRLGVRQFHTAGGGEAALEILKSHAVDLLITDVRMPGMDGMTLARELATVEKSRTRVIMISGFSDIDIREMYGAGVEAYLPKPVGTGCLLRTVEGVVSPPSSRWLAPLETPPSQALHVALSRRNRDSFLLGRGGFCIRFTEAPFLGKTTFHCHLPEHPIPLSGQGHVRWVSKSDELVGVEIDYLDPSCRSWVLEEMKNNMAHSFIPEGRSFLDARNEA